MKIKVEGKQHLKGISKKTGNEYDFIQIHYLGKARNVIGNAALTLSLDPHEYNFENIQVGQTYEVECDPRGYIQTFELVK